MKDQVDALRAKGVVAARLDSSLSQEEFDEVMGAVNSGDLQLLYVAPERLSNEGFRRKLRRMKIAMVAVDEAHCISEWGHNFRPDYLKLARLFRALNAPRVLCLTATATPGVAADIRREFSIAEEDHIGLSFHRANLDLRVTTVEAKERKQMLLGRLRQTDGACVVYVTLQHTAEEVATFLQKQGVSAQAYHAGMPPDLRAAAQEKFMSGEVRVVVATIAFGMGIDKSDIRAVFHYNLPKSLENYTQETGRAGRDGLPSVCEMLACGDDLVTLENFIYGDTPTPEALRHLVDHVLRLGKEFDVSVYELSTVNDIRPLVVNTLLTYLELEGLIEATRPFASKWVVKLLRDFEKVLHGYNEERKSFLRKIFAAAKQGRTWVNFEVDEVAMKTGETRERIALALGHLESMGDLVLKRSGIRQGYRLLHDDVNPRDVAVQLEQRFQKREQADLERLQEVVELVETDQCLTRVVTRHFGEEIEDCGHCDRCRGKKPTSLPRSAIPEWTSEMVEAVQQVKDEGHVALKSPGQLARFLCGMRSPAQQREKLSRHDAFGSLEEMPFAEVLGFLEQGL